MILTHFINRLGVERVRPAVRGRERGHSDRRHPSAVDGQTRRAYEHEQSVHPAGEEETEKSHGDHGSARHPRADRQEARVRRGVPVQEPDADGVGPEGGDPQRRIAELAQDPDAVRSRAQTAPGGHEHQGGQEPPGRQKPAGPRHQ